MDKTVKSKLKEDLIKIITSIKQIESGSVKQIFDYMHKTTLNLMTVC